MKNINKYAVALLSGIMAVGAVSCEKADYPDRYRVADGLPTVYSVRYADRDVTITGAYYDEIICLLGDNLRSIKELWFNDQQALLNTSYITDNTLIISVPRTPPTVETDKIYMINKDKDTVTFDFMVIAPAPRVTSMSNEWAKPGELVTIYGDFFIDKADSPLEIAFPGADVPHSDMTFNGSSSVSFHVPQGATEGYVNVTSYSGSGRSRFQYLDSRNILFDWDGSRGGMATGHGWRNGVVHAPGEDAWEAIDGSYLYFGGAEVSGTAGETWNEDALSFNYWPDPDNGYPELSSLPEFAEYIEAYGVAGLQLKFEVLIPASSPWSSCAMQLIFTSNATVTYNTGNNAYFGNTAQPRYLWMPWTATGSYDTAGQWVTVSAPLSSFTSDQTGNTSTGTFNVSMLTGLSFFVWQGGVDGTDCTPEFAIDNIRVVPLQ